MEFNIVSEKNVTVGFVVNEANTIWKYAKVQLSRKTSEQATRELLAEVHSKYPEFCKAYPIVARYMCQLGQFNIVIFEKWLLKVKAHPWKTEAEYFQLQADYVTMLYRHKNPHTSAVKLQSVRDGILHLLQEEHSQFKKTVLAASEKVTAEETALAAKNKQELREFAEIVGEDGMERAGTVRVIAPDTVYTAYDIDQAASSVDTGPAPVSMASDLL